MARTDRPKAPLTVTGEAVLERDARAATSTQAYALRCRIVLACAEPGSFSTQVAAGLGVSVPTVMKWRGRFIDRGLPGLDGTVISELHRRHRAAEYLKFLRAIDKAVPAGLDVHIVCDNLPARKTPAVNKWIARRPRFHVHFTPTGSSWINQVERWFAYLTTQKLQRSAHKSVQALEADVRLDRAVQQQPETVRMEENRRGDPRVPRPISATNLRRVDNIYDIAATGACQAASEPPPS